MSFPILGLRDPGNPDARTASEIIIRRSDENRVILKCLGWTGKMTPLNLRFQPPRGARETILGFYFLPRTIDKLRAELPGGELGEYLNDETGFSAFVIRRLGLNMLDLREVVARAASEADVVAWLAARIEPQIAPALNAKLETFIVERMSPQDQVLVRERHPVLVGQPGLSKILDILDADDRQAFSRNSAAT